MPLTMNVAYPLIIHKKSETSSYWVSSSPDFPTFQMESNDFNTLISLSEKRLIHLMTYYYSRGFLERASLTKGSVLKQSDIDKIVNSKDRELDATSMWMQLNFSVDFANPPTTIDEYDAYFD